jgi:TonB family protein
MIVYIKNSKKMMTDFIKYIRFLFFLSFYFFSCAIYAQTDSINVEMPCSMCDSLYKRMCPDNPAIFGGPERVPEFQGGYKALFIFLADNIQYPQECVEKRIEGRVIVQFIITEEGKMICIKIRRSLHPALDEEALRVVKLMPDWQPASNSGVPTKMCYILPVLFKL